MQTSSTNFEYGYDINAQQIADNVKYELMQEHKKGRKFILNQKKKVKAEKEEKKLNYIVEGFTKKKTKLEKEIEVLLESDCPIKPQDRIIYLREFCRKNNLGLKDDDIRNALWEARSKKNGVIESFTPDTPIEVVDDNWVWDGLIMKSDSNLLSARAKTGKTTLMVEFIGKWSRGVFDEFLGKKFTGKCPPVIIVGTDMPANRWMKLLNKFGLAQINNDGKYSVIDPIKNLYTLDNPLHLDQKGLATIADLVSNYDESFLLLDSYQRCLPKGIQENSNNFSDPFQDLQEIISPHNCTLLVIHHSGKQRSNSAVDSARGHSSLTDSPSQCLDLKYLNRHEDLQDKRIILSTDGRGEGSNLIIKQEDTGWILEGNFEEVMDQEKHRKIIEALNERQEDIYKLVEERTNKNIYTTYVEAAAILDDEVEDKNRQARATLEQLVKKKLLKTSTVITDKDSRGKRYWTT